MKINNLVLFVCIMFHAVNLKCSQTKPLTIILPDGKKSIVSTSMNNKIIVQQTNSANNTPTTNRYKHTSSFQTTPHAPGRNRSESEIRKQIAKSDFDNVLQQLINKTTTPEEPAPGIPQELNNDNHDNNNSATLLVTLNDDDLQFEMSDDEYAGK